LEASIFDSRRQGPDNCAGGHQGDASPDLCLDAACDATETEAAEDTPCVLSEGVGNVTGNGSDDGAVKGARIDDGIEEAWIDKATIRQIDLDLDRTYTDLGLFGVQGPYQAALRELLLAYCCFRPWVGYVQGMGYLASTLLLYMQPPEAFVCMGNLLHKHHFPAFLLVDMQQIDLYAIAFNRVFASHLPCLHHHLQDTGVDCRLYLVEWWMTVFCTVLPISASSVVWDLLLLHGIAGHVLPLALCP
jgi:hypothetical protein